MTTTLSFGTVPGLTGEEQQQLTELTEAYNYHQSRNATKDKYYEGHVTLQDVNLGIALPKGLSKLEVGCNWGQKAVDALASRSMFDGFVSNGGALDGLQKLVADNRLIAAYAKACRDQLKYGCVFATLSADTDIGCRIRFHSPATASALWNGEKGRIDCGLAIIDTVQDEHQKDSWHPALVNFYTDTDVIVLSSNGSSWTADRKPHKMGRPLMEPLIWNATSNKPFGRSRLKRAIRSLIDDYVRTVANSTIALEFDTTPQKYILGVTDEQYDAITSDKFKQYVGALIAATSNPETGENPVFGQLAQGSLQPHVEKMRMTATQFAAATGLTVTDVGVVNNANPTSSDAILAQSQTLVLMAQQLNTGNGDALVEILEKIRTHFEKPVTITSGFRTASGNAKQKNAARYSQHLYGKAADIQVQGISVEDVAAYAESLMPDWGGVGKYPVKAGRAKGWVHVDTRQNKSRWTL